MELYNHSDFQVQSIEALLGMPRVLRFLQKVAFNDPARPVLGTEVTYTHPGWGLLFRGHITSEQQLLAAENETVAFEAEDASRLLFRTPFRKGGSSRIVYNAPWEAARSSLAVILQDILANLPGGIAAQTEVPSSLNAIIPPELSMGGQSLGTWLAGALRFAPNHSWALRYLEGQQCLSILDLDAGVEKSLRPGAFTPYQPTSNTPNLEELAPQSNLEGLYRSMTVEGGGVYQDLLEKPLTPGFDPNAPTDPYYKKRWKLPFPLAPFSLSGGLLQEPVLEVSLDTSLLTTTLDQVEENILFLEIDNWTPEKTLTANFTGIVAPFQATATSPVAGREGEGLLLLDDCYKYLAADGTVLWDDLALLQNLAENRLLATSTAEGTGQALVHLGNTLEYDLGDRIADPGHRFIVGWLLEPEMQRQRLFLQDRSPLPPISLQKTAEQQASALDGVYTAEPRGYGFRRSRKKGGKSKGETTTPTLTSHAHQQNAVGDGGLLTLNTGVTSLQGTGLLSHVFAHENNLLNLHPGTRIASGLGVSPAAYKKSVLQRRLCRITSISIDPFETGFVIETDLDNLFALGGPFLAKNISRERVIQGDLVDVAFDYKDQAFFFVG